MAGRAPHRAAYGHSMSHGAVMCRSWTCSAFISLSCMPAEMCITTMPITIIPQVHRTKFRCPGNAALKRCKLCRRWIEVHYVTHTGLMCKQAAKWGHCSVDMHTSLVGQKVRKWVF